jgi:acyl carrier protein
MDLKSQLIEWIRHHGHEASAVGADTAFLAQGHLNSIQLTDFILFVEELSGRPLALDQLDPENFVNVEAVYATFFGEQT